MLAGMAEVLGIERQDASPPQPRSFQIRVVPEFALP
jgi:hypothetical protein